MTVRQGHRAPAGTSQEAIDRLQGAPAEDATPEALAATLSSGIRRWRPVIERPAFRPADPGLAAGRTPMAPSSSGPRSRRGCRARLHKVPRHALLPIIVAVSAIGVRSAEGDPFGLFAAAFFGLRAVRDPMATGALGEDRRAAATIDIAQDDAGGERTPTQPLLRLWRKPGVLERC